MSATRLPAKRLCRGDVIYVVNGNAGEEIAFTVNHVRDIGNNGVILVLSRWLTYYGETIHTELKIHTELNVSADDVFTVVE